MPNILYTVLGLLTLLASLVFIGWLMWRALQRSENPPRLVVRWIITALVGGTLGFVLLRSGPSWGTGLTVPFFCVFLGVVLSLLWAPSVGTLLARPLTSLFDGGPTSDKPEPLYSIAVAKRKKGHAHEALWEVQQQLMRFPNDVTGMMLMAEIQAVDLNDRPGAQLTVQRLCDQPDQAPVHIAVALNQLADWQLKYDQDVDAARQTLEELVARVPETPWAHNATHILPITVMGMASLGTFRSGAKAT